MQGRRDHAILYDGECGFCRLSARAVLALDRRNRLRVVAIQSPEGQRLLAEVPEELRLASAHLVTPGGIVHSAGAAAEPLARLLPGGRYPAAAFRRYPHQTEGAYGWIAANRGRLGRLGLRAGAIGEHR